MSEMQLDPARPVRSPPALMEIDDVAELLHVSRSLLAKWRMSGKGPRFMKAGRRILYECGEVRRWLEAQQRSSTLG
ncbi:MAG: helix-turn-helix domain-containing protein [Hyphomonadaceae bacterium]|nr:helix-turn-helix domain-containing protein [Hyphomonadaceae bacterium]